jgi:hypothetical protein
MTSLKKSAANRENAKRSTGPTTKIGKLRASGNSAKHSLFARELFLDDEERGRFEEFRSALYQQLSPSTTLQQIKCDHIITSAWNLKSAYQLEMERWTTLRKEDVAKNVQCESTGEKYLLSQWYLAGNADLQKATRFLADLREDVQTHGWAHSKDWQDSIVKGFGPEFFDLLTKWTPSTPDDILLAKMLAAKCERYQMKIPGVDLDSLPAADPSLSWQMAIKLIELTLNHLRDLAQLNRLAGNMGRESNVATPVELAGRYAVTAARELDRAIQSFIYLKENGL